MVYDEAPAAAPAAPAAPAPAAAPVEAQAAAAAAPAAPAGEPTLHDFVLNLLQDPTAMQAFDLDPSGCLKNAGLTDITPADVQDVIPLVTDLVPTGGLPGLGAVPGLDAVPSLDGLPLDGLPLGGLPSVPGVPSLDDLTSSLSLDGGLGANGGWTTLESDNPLGALNASGLAEVGADGVKAAALGLQETPLGQLGVGIWGEGGLDGAHGGVGVYTPLGDLETQVNAEVNGSQGLYLDAGASSGDQYIGVATENGLAVHQNVLPSLPGVGDLAKGLSDPTAAASAIAGAVPALPAVPGLPQLPVSDLPLPSLSDLPVDLPVELPAVPALPVADLNNTVDGTQDTANGAVDGGQAGTLPDLGGHLPQLPDVGGLLPNLPVNLPELPVHLPQLPVELPSLPSLPVAGGVDAPSVVGNVVDHTGLGGVLNNNPVTDTVHNIVPDLHLGL